MYGKVYLHAQQAVVRMMPMALVSKAFKFLRYRGVSLYEKREGCHGIYAVEETLAERPFDKHRPSGAEAFSYAC